MISGTVEGSGHTWEVHAFVCVRLYMLYSVKKIGYICRIFKTLAGVVPVGQKAASGSSVLREALSCFFCTEMSDLYIKLWEKEYVMERERLNQLQ